MAANSNTPVEFRWGIISTGSIATKFVTDLLVDPASRNAHDISHKIVAVGSRTVSKAEAFVAEQIPSNHLSSSAVKAYGSYAEVFADVNVDAVYIGTPHTQHYEDALAAIAAGKHILCEKPITINAAELRALMIAAKERNVFLMEAMWTRFIPLSVEVKKIIDQGTLGLPVMLHADLSGDFDILNIPDTHRILDPNLAGGALLDLGPYPLFWAIHALYDHPENEHKPPTKITGNMVMTPRTPVDRSTVFTLSFTSTEKGSTSKINAQAALSCGITIDSYEPGVAIRCERGNILIKKPIYCPREFTIQYRGKSGGIEREETQSFDFEGKGWHFEADEVARCVREGKLQSDLWGLEKSLLEMEIFDQVRKQGGYSFPPGLEKVTN